MATPKTVKYKFNWILNNATRENIQKHDKNDPVKTQVFQTKLDNCLVEWHLRITYNEVRKSIRLTIRSEKSIVSNSIYSLNMLASIENHEIKFKKSLYKVGNLLSWPNFIYLDDLLNPTKKFIDDEKCLKLAFEINFTEVLKVDDLAVAPDEILYSQFFNNEKYSDFTFMFSSDDVELPVHRIVLDTHSPVFSKMFTTEMEEKKSNAVTFEDISSETMKSVLEFIYTGEFIFSDVESSTKILYVSEKYEIKELKKYCIDELLTKVNEENVLELFETADLYNALLLEKKCLSIIISNYENLESTEKYDELEKSLTKKITGEFSRLRCLGILTTEDKKFDILKAALETSNETLHSQFCNKDKYSDFTFKCSNDVELPVHRIVLGVHSAVFSKMFTTEMKEMKSSMVIFKDISSKTMKSALEFIYTGKYIFSDVESTIKILYVSEKYEIEELKKYCIDELMTKVNEENVLELFEAADLYNAILLEGKCLSIIIENFEKLKGTEQYHKLEKPHLIKKITDELWRLLGSADLTIKCSF